MRQAHYMETVFTSTAAILTQVKFLSLRIHLSQIPAPPLLMMLFSHSVMSNSATPWTAACQASLSFAISWSLLKLMSISWWCHPTISSVLCCLLLLPSIFPSIRVFSNESAVCIRWPKYWSFSFSPSNENLGLISFGLVRSPCSPRDSQGSSPTPQFKSINSLVLSLLYGPTLTPVCDYWKKHSFD